MGRHQSDGDGQIPHTLQIGLRRNLAIGFLIPFHSVKKCAVKKLVQQLLQLQFGVEFHDVVGESFLAEKMPQVIPREHESPRELMKPDSLGKAQCSNRSKTPGDIFLCLPQQPITKIAINVPCSPLQFLRRYLVKIRRSTGSVDVLG